MQEALSLARFRVALDGPADFDGWRRAARWLAIERVPGSDVDWSVAAGHGATEPWKDPSQPASSFSVPKEFVSHAETVVCHRDSERFAFLYGLLLRLAGEPNLMKIASDPDMLRFETMEKSVRRDTHKMRAFVRFRRIGTDKADRFVAWFEPDHFIVERNAPFFVRRFTGMRWTILTPYASADWDGDRLAIGPGASKADAPPDDGAEDLWRTYFRSIFNPARLKVKAMQAEMPKKYWRNLPEASLISGMIAGAEEASRAMIEKMPTEPAPQHAKLQARHWPTPKPEGGKGDGADATSVEELREAAKGCRRCPLWRDATQTVFGEGSGTARVVFVGEQPGDQEDIAGRPFIGPAGKVFDTIFDAAGIDRSKVYVTNAVKHFKFEPRGKRRIHSKPDAGEISACRWWIDRELGLIKPDLIVALGATAALSLLGKAVPVTRMRGEVIEREDGTRVFITIHPSFILRIREGDEAEAERARFLADMKVVKMLMAASSEPFSSHQDRP